MLTREAPAAAPPVPYLSAASAMMTGMPPEVALSPLVGRAGTLRSISDAVGLGGDPGGTALVGGDAGVGKSRLLAELSGRAVRAGWRILVGHCLDFGDSALPYLPFSEAFGRLAADAPDLARTLVERSPVIERLLPTRRTLSGPDSRAKPTDRAAMFDAVHQTLTQLARGAPLLLVVEDVHWADQSTRELLTFLFTRPPTPGLAVVASYRSDDLNRRHPLRPVLAEWHRLPTVSRVHVERLAEPDVRSLVASLQSQTLPEREVQRIVARAEGNPFFAEELVAAAGDCSAALPNELADLLLVRLERLDDVGRLAVRAASVAGRQVSHDLLALGSGLQGTDLDLALRATVDANVLVPVGGDGYAFRHALLGEAVYDDLLPGERVRLHAAYAKALAGRSAMGTAAELARHARAAHDLATATRASVRAGDEAMTVGGPDEAAQHYEQALELLADPEVAQAVSGGEGSSGAIDQVDLAMRACAAAVSAGHLFRALALVQDQLGSLPGEADPLDRARLLYAVASTAMLTDNRVDVLALTTEAIALLPPEAPTALRAQVLTVHSRVTADRARGDEAARWAGEAQAIARGLGRLDIAADAATTLARLERTADPEASEAAFLEAVAEARSGGVVTAELRGLYSLAGLHYELGRLPKALDAYQQTWRRAGEAGVPWGPYGLDARAMAAVVAHVSGDWDLAEHLVDMTGESPPELAEALLAAIGLEIAAGRGYDDWSEALNRVRPWWHRDGLIAIVSGCAAIELYAQAGDLPAAEAVRADVVSDVSALWQTSAWQAQIRLNTLLIGQLGSVAVHASGSERAELVDRGDALSEVTADVAAQNAARGRHVGPEGEAWLARAAAEHARLRWLGGVDPEPQDELLERWQAAVVAFERFGHVYETARSRARLAAVLRASGRAADAAEEVARVRTVATALGSEPLLAELRQLGVRAGHVRRPASSPRDAPLTPREQEVLGLVADGRSNAEIARGLFISAKTVSVHVSNIMAKLGAASRTEAAAVARRQGLLSDQTAERRPPA